MILADTNIISTFARVDSLPLLIRLMGEPKLFVTPAKYHEVRHLLQRIETEQGMVVKNKEAIFAGRKHKRSKRGRRR